QPTKHTLDSQFAILVDPVAQTKPCNSTNILVEVILRTFTTKYRNHILGKQFALAHSVLSVWHAKAPNATARKVRSCCCITCAPSIKHQFALLSFNSQISTDPQTSTLLDRKVSA